MALSLLPIPGRIFFVERFFVWRRDAVRVSQICEDLSYVLVNFLAYCSDAVGPLVFLGDRFVETTNARSFEVFLGVIADGLCITDGVCISLLIFCERSVRPAMISCAWKVLPRAICV